MPCIHFLPHGSDYVMNVTSAVTTLFLIITRDSTVQPEVQTHVLSWYALIAFLQLNFTTQIHVWLDSPIVSQWH